MNQANRKLAANILAVVVLVVAGLLVLATAGSLYLTAQPSKLKTLAVTPPPPVSPASPPTDQAAAAKLQADRITEAIAEMKERASGQQTLIGSLTTLTGLYTVILALAAYARLQQSRADTEETLKKLTSDAANLKSDLEKRIAQAEKDSAETLSKLRTDAASFRADLDERFRATEAKLKELIAEVRLDIPAVHGIGRRLEYLLAELQTRLPVDGDWTESDTYDKLNIDQREQALIDEMVINSLDIFNIRQDVGNRRTVCLLYVRVGQFYFGKAAHLRAQTQKEAAVEALYRATIYFTKAIEADARSAIAQRARGVSAVWTALWKKEDEGSADLDPALLGQSEHHVRASLDIDACEPGALFLFSWLLRRRDDLEESLKKLSELIALEPKLALGHRRKYVFPAFLNRATNRAVRLERMAAPDTALVESETQQIVEDIRESFRVANACQRVDSLKKSLAGEILPTGDLPMLYLTHVDVHAAVDQILAA